MTHYFLSWWSNCTVSNPWIIIHFFYYVPLLLKKKKSEEVVDRIKRLFFFDWNGWPQNLEYFFWTFLDLFVALLFLFKMLRLYLYKRFDCFQLINDDHIKMKIGNIKYSSNNLEYSGCLHHCPADTADLLLLLFHMLSSICAAPTYST